MAQALYRTYRPKSLEEVAGQEHITTTLKNALKSNRISHAYLFTGPRGVGKTSIARILAHEINGIPYTDETNHIDIIEIDAASNGGVEDARELRERAFIAPSQYKHKVYIIDEVHMLSPKAFDALLKIIEEPPEHVIFILATTESHKVPATIISRTQRFNFKPIDKKTMGLQLEKIAKAEKVKITAQAIQLLSEHADGSLRDAESLLDQAISEGQDVDVEKVMKLLGLPPKDSLNELYNSYAEDNDSKTVISKLSSLYQQGFQAGTIAHELINAVRESIIDSTSHNLGRSLDLMKDLIEVSASPDPERYLEIILLKNCYQEPSVNKSAQTKLVKAAQISKKEIEINNIKPDKVELINTPVNKGSLKSEISKPKPNTKPTNGLAVDEKLWNDLLTQLKKKYNTLYGIVKTADPSFSDDTTLNLGFEFEFHRKRLAEANNQQIIRDILKDLTAKDMSIVCYLDKSIQPKPKYQEATKSTPNSESPNIANISNIFGDAKVIES